MASFIIKTLPKKEGKNSKLDNPMVEEFQGCFTEVLRVYQGKLRENSKFDSLKLRENSISMEITMWGEEGVSNGN